MLVQVLLEGLGLGALLVLVCAIGIRKGIVGMAISSAVLSGIMALSAGEDRAHFSIAVRYIPCYLKHWAISISPPYCFSMPWA